MAAPLFNAGRGVSKIIINSCSYKKALLIATPHEGAIRIPDRKQHPLLYPFFSGDRGRCVSYAKGHPETGFIVDIRWRREMSSRFGVHGRPFAPSPVRARVGVRGSIKDLKSFQIPSFPPSPGGRRGRGIGLSLAHWAALKGDTALT
jgi:hypothetical protein